VFTEAPCNTFVNGPTLVVPASFQRDDRGSDGFGPRSGERAEANTAPERVRGLDVPSVDVPPLRLYPGSG
jgi:hypothetical protein